MRTLQDNAKLLAGSEDDRALPPGGGLLIAVAISAAFWGCVAWAIL